MKFRTKTSMEAASVQEVTEAAQQGSLLDTTINGQRYGQVLSSLSRRMEEDDMRLRDRRFLWMSCVVGAIGIITLLSTLCWIRTRRNRRSQSRPLNEPLVN